MNEKISLEYIFGKTPTKLLWQSISTAHGLESWFAERVELEGAKYTFHWADNEQTAHLRLSRIGTYVRLKWDHDTDSRCYFEMRVTTDEITQDTILTISELINKEEAEDAKALWDIQVARLKDKFGV